MTARTLLFALAALLVLSPAAAAERGPCLIGQSGPECHVWTGTVGPVYDGDSIRVDVDGVRGRPAHVRLTGIQAMELNVYGRKRGRAGECTAVRAAERLEELIRAGGNRVRLAALHEDSTTGPRLRPRRHVAFWNGTGWVDAGATLLEEGLAVWFPNAAEWVWNGSYARLAQDAARRGVGIWDSAACGEGPGQTLAPLRLKVKWNASGNDFERVNGEWVRITNPDPVEPVSLAGWWFRDSHLRRYRFLPGTLIPPGLSIKVHIGKGRDTADTFHWGLEAPVFDNATADRKQIGDGGYLFDPRGNLRAHVQYPCRVSCTEPLAGKLAVSAHPRGREYIRLRNVSDQPINLFEYELERDPWFYELGKDSLLLPGQRLDVYTRRTPVSAGPLTRNWGWRTEFLRDDRGAITVRNPVGAPVACHTWGSARCPGI